MLQICLDFVLIQFRLYYPNCFSLEKRCLGEGVFGLYNPKKSSNAPYFLNFSDYKIRIGEELIFHPITKEKHEFEF